MKKIIFISVILLGLVACKEKAVVKVKTANVKIAKERDTKISLGSAEIEFDKTTYNFGTITSGEVIEGAFTIYNKGAVDLVITSAKSSCGCTVPEWPKEPIKPGDTAQLKFKFNSRGRSGKQYKAIRLKTNTKKMTEIIKVAGMVKPNERIKNIKSQKSK